jgi:hypothetical protein
MALPAKYAALCGYAATDVFPNGGTLDSSLQIRISRLNERVNHLDSLDDLKNCFVEVTRKCGLPVLL